MAIWDQFITERDKQVYGKYHGGRHQGFGQRPAVLIIDVNYGWVGGTPEPVLQSIEKYPSSCGLEGWDAVYQIQRLLKMARASGIPVFYTTASEMRKGIVPGGKHTQREHSPEFVRHLRQIVDEIAPIEGEVVIYKHAPSAFFCTPLITYLTQLKIDTLLTCGGSTSGCVRASVVDAASNRIKVSLIEECTFDRGQASHAINLFDMNAKYADIVNLEDIEKYLATLPEDLFSKVARSGAAEGVATPA